MLQSTSYQPKPPDWKKKKEISREVVGQPLKYLEHVCHFYMNHILSVGSHPIF